MKKALFYIMLYTFTMAIYGCKSDSTSSNDDNNNNNNNNGEWELVWSDEFKYTGLPDSTKWAYDVGGSGWGNNELQYYTSKRLKNARVEDDVLIIEAHKEDFLGKKYTSARLLSTGEGNWTYGRFEVKARLPQGRGTWPAIWMLPTDWVYGGWPNSGEIDIMEHVGYDPGAVHGSTHSLAYYWRINTQKTATIKRPESEVMNNYNVYALEWSADTISIFYNEVKYFTFANEHQGWEKWPFDQAFHFLLNIAIGGDWGGVQGVDDNIFPQQMEIDYVRVYKKREE